MDEENKKIERPNWICDPCGATIWPVVPGKLQWAIEALRYIPQWHM